MTIKRLASLAGAAVVCACVVLLAASAASAKTDAARRVLVTPATLPLRTAFVDPRSFSGASPAFGVAAAAGASYIRVPFNWSSLAPAVRPAGFVATDPASYAWSWLDTEVTTAEAAGLTPFLDILSPPQWAYAIKPQIGNGGTPNISELGQFAKALALHYDGTHGVPAVHVFQVWNEPNNTHDLSPTEPDCIPGDGQCCCRQRPWCESVEPRRRRWPRAAWTPEDEDAAVVVDGTARLHARSAVRLVR